jgi:hypothetical protein
MLSSVFNGWLLSPALLTGQRTATIATRRQEPQLDLRNRRQQAIPPLWKGIAVWQTGIQALN